MAVAVCLSLGLLAQEPGASIPAVGPRSPVGPDVPLNDAEQKQFARRVTVEGRTAADVQAACERAVQESVRVVFLPAGEYVFEAEVPVPEGLTLFGEGSPTLIRTHNRDTHLFRVEGDRVRFTRLKLQGADPTPSENNDTYGITVSGKQNVRIDHCELLGFSYATDFNSEATAQIDHCSIHHNLRDGLGYGVALYSGAYVLIIDNEFSQNRHSLSSNGTLDWGSGERLGKYLHMPGRKTHWEFRHNRVGSNDLSVYELSAVDTHPGMDGTFVVEGNLFENLRHGVDIRDGSGLIQCNLFRNLRGKPFRPWLAISISYDTHNGIPVEGCMPHDIEVAENTFLNVGDQAFADGVILEESAPAGKAVKYVLGQAENITIEGQLVPETQKEGTVPPPIPWLQEMGEEGVLNRRLLQNLTRRWTIANKDVSLYAVSGGVCRVSSGNGDMYWDSFNYRNLFRIPCPTTNDFCATIRLNGFQPTNDNVQIALFAYDSEDNHVRYAYGHLDGARAFRFFAETNGEPQAAFTDIPFDLGAVPFWMRLTKQGNVYRQYWSTNGVVFHRIDGSVAYGDGTPDYLAFWVGADFSFPPSGTPATVESFEVSEFPDYPAVTAIGKSGGTVTIAVQNLYAATTARVDRCTSLLSNDWTSLGSFEVSADSTNVVDSALPSTNRFFYRIALP
ncbi:MAG: hypothetical protein BWK77_02915 [Verrucomicrobia bacterium A1]|nr:MAG: hypothetical protein BWK77_02915 [Verrucomicrobia bacterium A1]